MKNLFTQNEIALTQVSQCTTHNFIYTEKPPGKVHHKDKTPISREKSQKITEQKSTRPTCSMTRDPLMEIEEMSFYDTKDEFVFVP